MKRRLLALVSALLLIVSVAVPVFADVIQRDSTVYAGELYIVSSLDCVSSSGSSNVLGHAFLIYCNTTDSVQYFGDLRVPAGVEITVGTSGVEVFDGVWYNLEAFYHRTNNSYQYNYYTSMSLSLVDLAQISNIIMNWDSYDLWTNNCVHFATTIWNAVSYNDFYAFSPQELILEIADVSDDENYDITTLASPIYYSDGVWVGRPTR